MRSPLTIGVEMPTPASGAFHATFSVALQRVGSAASEDTPVACGPRQCGQSSAWSAQRPPIHTAESARSRSRDVMPRIM